MGLLCNMGSTKKPSSIGIFILIKRPDFKNGYPSIGFRSQQRQHTLGMCKARLEM